jgi:hypothetical protein
VIEVKESTMKFSGSATGAAILALAALVLAGCVSIPYEVAAPKSVQRQLERELGDPPADLSETEASPRKRAISLCYGRGLNTPEELKAEAQLICANGEVEYIGSDTFWTPCSLAQPVRATFMCTPAP